ncbi:hypothetical protein Swit_5279 (plasmid) [Rhizorhabdus wittichii RW1]|uniref:Uncharacterized protein n=1 Tax=Rhizorhabdus wittichii (strain DSM 6014 / CCUG 31198 / JCM 15750 / NBRC 105917 / EY 4224 / RW1) TaxID=392499 RepID=A0A9J9LF27_RHIWR|nr:hypothetical protein Swit_5279 [Rhizorhabdus wittichii RW1]
MQEFQVVRSPTRRRGPKGTDAREDLSGLEKLIDRRHFRIELVEDSRQISRWRGEGSLHAGAPKRDSGEAKLDSEVDAHENAPRPPCRDFGQKPGTGGALQQPAGASHGQIKKSRHSLWRQDRLVKRKREEGGQGTGTIRLRDCRSGFAMEALQMVKAFKATLGARGKGPQDREPVGFIQRLLQTEGFGAADEVGEGAACQILVA